MASPEEYLSNLGNLWPDPTGNTFGDIEVLESGYGPFVVYFFTGSDFGARRYAKIYDGVPPTEATNSSGIIDRFRLDSVTFQFVGGILQPWSNVTVQVYQQVDSNSIPLGGLGNPSLNPTTTPQWPWFSSFIDFHPLTNIVLQPSSKYFVSLSESYDLIPAFAMIFSLSSNYITSTDWRMGPTTTHVPVNFTEYLKFAVNATAIQSTNSTSGVGTNSRGGAVSKVMLSVSSVGNDIVLSWPASMGPCQLYQTSGLESGQWASVPAHPVVINDRFVVTLPLSSLGGFFRLQGQ